jgi:xeroderma pigmentosum group C-complementing protein
MIHKSRVPEQGKRGRMFEAAVTRLAEWWSGVFFEVIPDGHVRNRTFASIQKLLNENGVGPNDDIETGVLPDILDTDHEPIKSPKSLMKHAIQAYGSRDTSAQLFTALCRALGVPTRLVVSLQSVPWQAAVGKPKPKYTKSKKSKGKQKAAENAISEAEDDMEEVNISRASSSAPGSANGAFSGEGHRLDGSPVGKSDKAKGKEKAKPEVKLRKTKSKGRKVGTSSSTKPIGNSSYSLSGILHLRKSYLSDPLQSPPVFWTEVFSRPDGRWLPVDPLRGIVNNRKVFDPSALGDQAENRILYVLAIEEDGYARDVTRRYAKDFGAKVAKVQGGSSSNVGNTGGEKGRLAWWERVMRMVTRPYRLVCHSHIYWLTIEANLALAATR